MQERRKALKSGRPQRLNRIDLYGKNLIPMEKLQYKNLEGHGPWFLCLCLHDCEALNPRPVTLWLDENKLATV